MSGRLYLNGVQVATNAAMTLDPLNLGLTASNWFGRSQYAGDPYFNGKLDDVRVSCRPYSAQEMAVLAGRDPLAYYSQQITAPAGITDAVALWWAVPRTDPRRGPGVCLHRLEPCLWLPVAAHALAGLGVPSSD